MQDMSQLIRVAQSYREMLARSLFNMPASVTTAAGDAALEPLLQENMKMVFSNSGCRNAGVHLKTATDPSSFTDNDPEFTRK